MASEELSTPRRPSNPGSRSSFSSQPHPIPPDNTGVGVGPGPLRHPRPLTASELHWQLEKEQEAVVNRLTRELSQLRAQQSASVVSTTSSASDQVIDHQTDGYLSTLHHAAVPTPARQRRSSSNVSRNVTGTTGGSAAVPGGVPGGVAIHTTTPSQASIERARVSVSRQSSVTSRRSRTSSPHARAVPTAAVAPLLANLESLPPHYQHRQSLSSTHHPLPPSSSSPTTTTFPAATAAISRYEEAAMHKADLDAAKRENEALKRRIRELERVVRGQHRPSSTNTELEEHGRGGSSGGNVQAEAGAKMEKDAREGRSNSSDGGGGGGGGGVKVGESASSRGYDQ